MWRRPNCTVGANTPYQPSDGSKCGMTQELAMPALGEDENKEHGDFQRRFYGTLPPTIAVPDPVKASTAEALAAQKASGLGVSSWPPAMA